MLKIYPDIDLIKRTDIRKKLLKKDQEWKLWMYSYRYLQLGLEYSVGLRHKWTSIFDDGTKRLLWYILYFDL